MRFLNKTMFAVGVVLTAISLHGCKKLVEVSAPVNSLNSANVYTNDATAIAVLTYMYANMSAINSGSSIPTSLFLFGGLSADELTLYDINNAKYRPYYINALANTVLTTDFWRSTYPLVFQANAAIEGLSASSSLTPAVKQQLLGEAYFLRAFYYFDLVNLYGDVPLALTTDYRVNNSLSRTPSTRVWQQIVTDLHMAQSLLSNNFLDGTLLKTTTERVRPNKWAATALLARSYLYTNNWVGADSAATALISNSAMFNLGTFTGSTRIFAKNSPETIWALQGVGSNPPTSSSTVNTGEGLTFVLPSSGPNTSGTYPVYLSNTVLGAFEVGDLRKINWINSVTVNGSTYNYPYKYQAGLTSSGSTEYSIQLRLAEQYLIRAEAEAHENKTTNSVSDLNTIRTRAGLSGYAGGTDLSSLQIAILHERQVELFTEGAHRWFDLKRTNSIDAVMGAGGACAAKGGTWNSNWQYYPIASSELLANPNLIQNSGY